MALSSDGKQVLTGSYETAILWEAASGKKLQTFRGHTEGVRSVALASDGKHVWTGSTDRTARLWDAASGKELCALYNFDRGKDWLVVTPDGLFDGSKGAWKYVTYREAATRNRVNDDGTRKKFHRPGLLAQLVKGEKPKPPAEFKELKGADLLVLTLKRDIHALEGGHPRVYANLAFSPDGKVLACSDRKDDDENVPVVKLWDVDKRQVITTLGRPTYRVSSLAFSPDGKTLATGGRDGGEEMTVRLWDVATGKEKASLPAQSQGFCPLAFSPDGKTLASGGDNAGKTSGTGGRGDNLGVKLWDLTTGKERASLKGHGGPVVCVAFSPDGKFIASGDGRWAPNGQSWGGEVKVWDAATGRERVTLGGRGEEVMGVVWSVAFSPDSKTLASADTYGNVLLWDVQSGKRAARLQRLDPKGEEEDINSAWSVAFSPDGKTLAAGTVRGIMLWDVQSGKKVGPPMGPPAAIWSVTFSPDGKTVASAGKRRVISRFDRMEGDETLRLWEWSLPKTADK